MHWEHYKVHLFYIAYIFETSYGLYILWKEIKQLQPQDQNQQQVKTDHSLAQTLPPPEELLIEVREQIIQPPFMEQISPLQDLQQDTQVFDTEYSINLYTPTISIERTFSPLVIYNDQVFMEFVNGEERCQKFVNQDLAFLQASEIPTTFRNISHVSAKVKESTCFRLPIHICTEDNSTLCTQMVEPALGFTPAEICHAQNEPKLMVQQLLEIESCKDYIKTLIQTLDGMYMNQPKRFLPLPRRQKNKQRNSKKRKSCLSGLDFHLKNYYRSHSWNN